MSALEFVVINDIGSVVSFVTDNQEVIKSTLGLNIAEIRFDDVNKVCSGDLIIEFKRRACAARSSACSTVRNSLLTLIRSNAEA